MTSPSTLPKHAKTRPYKVRSGRCNLSVNSALRALQQSDGLLAPAAERLKVDVLAFHDFVESHEALRAARSKGRVVGGELALAKNSELVQDGDARAIALAVNLSERERDRLNQTADPVYNPPPIFITPVVSGTFLSPTAVQALAEGKPLPEGSVVQRDPDAKTVPLEEYQEAMNENVVKLRPYSRE
jgi:hypothetical protein